MNQQIKDYVLMCLREDLKRKERLLLTYHGRMHHEVINKEILQIEEAITGIELLEVEPCQTQPE